MKTIFAVVILAVGGTGGFFAWNRYHNDEQAPQFRTAAVDRGDVHWMIASTGHVNPVTTRSIGSQVSGVITSLTVDFNSPVKAGEVIATLDDRSFVAAVAQQKASLQKAEADLGRVQANLTQAENVWKRAQVLQSKGKGFITDTDFDAAKAGFDTSTAAVNVAHADVAIAKAALQAAEINLGYCTITCPIDGVVVSRQVDVGQTVAAGFAAPVLYTIGEDLSKVQVMVSVDEADIGRIAVGQSVSFTVDTFGTEEFKGLVSMVRLNPTAVQNVTTYSVMVDTANPPEPPAYPYGRLFPGLTTNVLFRVDDRSDVVRIPNAALRFHPDPALVLPGAKIPKTSVEPAIDENLGKPGQAPGAKSGDGPKINGAKNKKEKQLRTPGETHTAWVVDGKWARPIVIKTGISDNTMTEMLTGDLKPGDQVIVGVQTHGGANDTTNPFVFRRK